MNIRTLIFGAAVLCAVSGTWAAAPASEGGSGNKTVSLSYRDYNSPDTYYGTGKTETYNIAAKFLAPDFGNAEVVGAVIDLRADAKVEDVAVWLTRELTIEKVDGKNCNVPDIVSVDAVVKDGRIEVQFPAPVAIADGLYLGYTFTVPQGAVSGADKLPVVTCQGATDHGLYVYTSRTEMSWKNLSAKKNMTASIAAVVRGDVPAVGIKSIVMPEDINAVAMSGVAKVPLQVCGVGADAITDMQFAYTLQSDTNHFEGTATKHFDTPFTPQYGVLSLPIEVEINTAIPIDNYQLTLTAVSVNSQTVASTSAQRPLYAVSHFPTRGVLMENYTGFWCGYCPRGHAAIERMHRLYPEEFIVAEFHKSDPLWAMPESEFPSDGPGYPAADINRTLRIDPYYGQRIDRFGLEEIWLKHRQLFTPVDIAAQASWREGTAVFDLGVNVSTVKDMEHPVRVGWILLTDNMTDPEWSQSNYYWGGPAYDIEEMDVFVNGSGYMHNIRYDNIAIASSPKNATDAMTAVMSRGDGASFSFEISAADIHSIYEECTDMSLVRNASDLKVLVTAEDADTREVLNCCVVPISGISGVATAVADSAIVAEEYYTLTGVRITPSATAVQGPVIKVIRRADGSVQSLKSL